MKKKLLSAIIVMLLVVLFSTAKPAKADGTINWQGHGKENLPCTGGIHVVFTPGGGSNVTAAKLITNNYGTAVMTQSGNNGSWSADIWGTIGTDLTMSVDYVGEVGRNPGVQLSHCLPETPPETPTPTPETATPPPNNETPTPTPETATPPPPSTEKTPTPVEQNTAGGSETNNIGVVIGGVVLLSLTGWLIRKKG